MTPTSDNVKITLDLGFNGTIYGEDGSTIEYTNDDPFIYQATLTSEQLWEAYDCCPNNTGYDFAVNLSDAVKTYAEDSITLYKIWDDDSNAGQYRDNITSVSVYLECSEDGETWEDVVDEYGAKRAFIIHGSADSDIWRLTLTSGDLDLTYTADDGSEQDYLFRISAEQALQNVTGNAQYTYTIGEDELSLTVTNTLGTYPIDITGEKQWLDEDEEPLDESLISGHVNIALYQDGKFYDMQIVTAEDDWSFSFTNLPQLPGENAHIYVLAELDDFGNRVNDEGHIILGDQRYKVQIVEQTSENEDDDNQADENEEDDSVRYVIINTPDPFDKKVDTDDDDDFNDDGEFVHLGDTLTYSIEYENDHDTPSTIIITDVLDVGLDYVYGTATEYPLDSDDDTAFSITCIYDGNRTLTWIIENAPAHTSGSVTFQATVNEKALVKNEVDNTASVKIGEHEAVETNTVYNPVTHKDVDVNEDGEYGDAGKQVQVGDTLTYIIYYENPDDKPATVTITDVLDIGLDYVLGTADPDALYDYDRTLTWVITDVEPHSSKSVTFQATVNEKALEKMKVENTATVQVNGEQAVETNTVQNPFRQYFPIDEEIVTDTEDIFNTDAWVKNESVNEYNAIEIEMTTTLPLVAGEDIASGGFTMNFHEVLDHELVLDEDTTDFSVYIAGQRISTDYYRITFDDDTGDDCNFHVDVDLTALYNGNIVTDDMLDGNTEITIFFFADLEGTGLNGSYGSTIWYEIYDGDEWLYMSNFDYVYVYTYDINIVKYDASTIEGTEYEDYVDAGLQGAVFGLYYDEDYTTPVSRNGEPYTVTSNRYGHANFYGLAEGTYYVAELEAPAGYKSNNEASMVVLSDETTVERVYRSYIGNEPTKINVSGSKTWDDSDNQDGNRPESITVRLLANGAYATDDNGDEITATLTEENDWSFSFTDLPEYERGLKINYRVTEDAVDDYSPSYTISQDETGDYTITITNTHTPDKTSVLVVKDWDDFEDADGIRPDSVTFELYADGKPIGDRLTVSADDNWMAVFSDLDIYHDGGERIVYTVQEIDMPSEYTVESAGNALEGFRFVNEHTPDSEPEPEPVPEPEEFEPVKEVSAGEGNTVKVGDELTYTITYKNTTEGSATIIITDTLENGLTFVSATDGGTYDSSSRTVTWTLENIESDYEGRVELVVTVNSTGRTNGSVSNTASVQVGEGSDPESTNPVTNPVSRTSSLSSSHSGSSSGGGVRQGTNSGPGADNGSGSSETDSSSSIHDTISSDDIGELPATGESNMTAILIGLCAVFVVLLAALFYMRRKAPKDQV